MESEIIEKLNDIMQGQVAILDKLKALSPEITEKVKSVPDGFLERNKISRIITSHCEGFVAEIDTCYSFLYDQFRRMHGIDLTNPYIIKTYGTPMDYAIKKGHIDKLVTLAKKVFKS